MQLNIIKLGICDYAWALRVQERLLAARQQGEIGNTMLLLQHPPTLTVGYRGKETNILASPQFLEEKGVNVFEINRGGDVTYHGPGQLVGYPIMDLTDFSRDIKEYVGRLEDVFIHLLADEYEITAHQEEKKYTGVWVGDEKITAIGIAVKRWVTMHGFAFNINTDMSYFRLINPCGITDKGVTSLRQLTGTEQDMDKLYTLTADYFCREYELEPHYTSLEELGIHADQT